MKRKRRRTQVKFCQTCQRKTKHRKKGLNYICDGCLTIKPAYMSVSQLKREENKKMKKQKTDKQLLEIWDENERQIIRGLNAYEDLSSHDKARIFDLIADGEHKK